ncbi:MAG: type II toxin-antitoxin system PemK/MazF family toxin [bacterium]
MEIKRGEIWLADLNPTRGTEQRGVRPVLIIQIDRANNVSPHTIIAPFTTKIRDKLLPCHVAFQAGEGGLSQDSVLLTEQVRVIDKSRLERKIGTVSKEKLEEVENAFRVIMGL